MEWYQLQHPDLANSPSLVVYPDRIAKNIAEMIRVAGSADRLVPHVKTHKMPQVVAMQLAAGIDRFKCATIAEAEMTAAAGAKGIILAHQLVGPKVAQWAALCRLFPNTDFAALTDCPGSARHYSQVFGDAGLTAQVLVDVNNGMNRSGIAVAEALAFYRSLAGYPHLHCQGLHVYDGSIRDADFDVRKAKSDRDFAPVEKLAADIVAAGLPAPIIVAGGSPSFTVHALRNGVYCSPGTCLLWDWGYGDILPEQAFLWAAVLLTRVISKPAKGLATLDLGHKAVAAENPLEKRVKFLNLPAPHRFVSQSEEHLVLELETTAWGKIAVGDVLYGVPYHVCPTVNLYEEVLTAENHQLTGVWQVTARKRKISV